MCHYYLRSLGLSENSYDLVVEEKGRDKNDSDVWNVLTDIMLATLRKTVCLEEGNKETMFSFEVYFGIAERYIFGNGP